MSISWGPPAPPATRGGGGGGVGPPRQHVNVRELIVGLPRDRREPEESPRSFLRDREVVGVERERRAGASRHLPEDPSAADIAQGAGQERVVHDRLHGRVVEAAG